MSQALNYGIDKARFLAPVRSGKRIRAHTLLAAAEEKPGGRVLLTVSCRVEIEGEERPALVADLISLMLPGQDGNGGGHGKDGDGGPDHS